MANTYTQLNIHAVCAVKWRANLLTEDYSEALFKYMSGILSNINQFPLAVNGYQDHVHLLFELHPLSSVADIMRIVKANSSKWIKENKFVRGKFSWQPGYGAFACSKSHRSNTINYIKNQKSHHMEKTFRDEYLQLLEEFEIEFNPNYLFDFYLD